MTVYSTKIVGEEFRQMFLERGVVLDQDNHIATERMVFEKPESGADLILFSSWRGVEALGDGISELGNIPIAVVGRKSEETLKALGYKTEYVASDVSELIAWLETQSYQSPVYYCSEQHLPDLPHFFRDREVNLNIVPVYRTMPCSILIPTKAYEVIMFFSPSGVESFFERNHWPLECKALAIGNTTASALEKYVNKELIHIAHHPNMRSSIEKCIELVKDRTEI